MISLCFFILPFTYFYAEEALDSEDEFQLNYGSGDDDDDYELDTNYSKTPKSSK